MRKSNDEMRSKYNGWNEIIQAAQQNDSEISNVADEKEKQIEMKKDSYKKQIEQLKKSKGKSDNSNSQIRRSFSTSASIFNTNSIFNDQ